MPLLIYCLVTHKGFAHVYPTNCTLITTAEFKEGARFGKVTQKDVKKVFLGFRRGLVDRSTMKNQIIDGNSILLNDFIEIDSEKAFYKDGKALNALEPSKM